MLSMFGCLSIEVVVVVVGGDGGVNLGGVVIVATALVELNGRLSSVSVSGSIIFVVNDGSSPAVLVLQFIAVGIASASSAAAGEEFDTTKSSLSLLHVDADVSLLEWIICPGMIFRARCQLFDGGSCLMVIGG